MKKFSILALSCVACLLITGCGGVAYGPTERSNQIARNWDLEGKMFVDDTDSVLLLRPVSQLTPWHVRGN